MKSWLKTKTSRPPDGAVAGHHPVRRSLNPLHEAGFQVLGEGHEFHEASWVQKVVYSLPGGEFPLLVLLADAFLSPAEKDSFPPFLQLSQ